MTSTSGSDAHTAPASQTRAVPSGCRNALSRAIPDTACVRTVGIRVQQFGGEASTSPERRPRHAGSRYRFARCMAAYSTAAPTDIEEEAGENRQDDAQSLLG